MNGKKAKALRKVASSYGSADRQYASQNGSVHNFPGSKRQIYQVIKHDYSKAKQAGMAPTTRSAGDEAGVLNRLERHIDSEA